MRLGNGEVMLPLVGPVYDCCELIVDNDCINEDECDCLSLQVRGKVSEGAHCVCVRVCVCVCVFVCVCVCQS